MAVLADESVAAVPAAGPSAAATSVSGSLSVPAVESAAVAEPAGKVAAAAAVSESPSVLAVEPGAVVEPAIGSAAVQGRPVLVGEPAAAPRESWIMNSAISPKVIVKMAREGSAVKAVSRVATTAEKAIRRVSVRAGMHSSSKTGDDGVCDSSPCGRARAGNAGGGGTGQEEGEGWRD